MTNVPQTVIGVPGRWIDRADIVTSIATRSDGYLFAGTQMMKAGSRDGFTVDVYEHDPNMVEAFSIAGHRRLTDSDLEAIASHTFTLYLVADGGSVEAAMNLLHGAHAVLKAGGIAVKIESSGTAHRADQWAGYCDRGDLPSLLQAFVAYLSGDGICYSCGMHNLGFRDAVVEADIPIGEAAKLVNMFLKYILIENLTIEDGETFSVDENSSPYRLFREDCTMYPADDLFYNPVWPLENSARLGASHTFLFCGSAASGSNWA